MEAVTIDHPNLRIPIDGKTDGIEFYCGVLGFEADRLDAHESGDLSFFSIRLTHENVIHFWPDEGFETPTRSNFDHLAIRLNESVEDIKETLAGVEVEILDEFEPLGATGEAPAVYIEDPFGYVLELKCDD